MSFLCPGFDVPWFNFNWFRLTSHYGEMGIGTELTNISSVMAAVLKRGTAVLTCPHHVADRGQFAEGGIVGQDVLDGDLVSGAADVSLLAQVAEA